MAVFRLLSAIFRTIVLKVQDDRRYAKQVFPMKGFNVWQPSWTCQEAYGNAKQYWERVVRKGKS